MKKLFFMLICILVLSGCINGEISPGTAGEAPSNDAEEASLLEIAISKSAVAAMNAELGKQENHSKIYKVVYNHAGNG
ncbi:MAG TPA: hypothetical protein DEF04_05480 [Clostridiales bacterium]|nr:hypothetical protein [Clostridiales bacterium]